MTNDRWQLMEELRVTLIRSMRRVLIDHAFLAPRKSSQKRKKRVRPLEWFGFSPAPLLSKKEAARAYPHLNPE
jgi:hypothetical protein